MEKSKDEKKLTLSEYMLKELEDTFRMFRDDLQKVKDAMEVRVKKVEEIKAEQSIDLQRKLQLNGALSVCTSLVTKYKQAMANEKRATRKTKKVDG